MYLTRYSEPEAVGRLVAEYICCGKPNCRCVRGAKHGPYWYLHYRRYEAGHWIDRKRYVPRPFVPVVRGWLNRTKRRDRLTMALIGQGQELRNIINNQERASNDTIIERIREFSRNANRACENAAC